MKQQTALIIANGLACSSSLLKKIVYASEFVLVLDGAIQRVLEHGVVPNMVLGDFDSIDNLYEIKKTYPYLPIMSAPDQDKTDLEKGIEFLIKKKHKKIVVLWATGRRTDHFLNNLSTLVKYKKSVVVEMIDDYSRISNLPLEYKKKYIANTLLSLLPMGTVKGVTTIGLQYNLTNATLALGKKTSSSNASENKNGFVRITHQSGNLLLIESAEQERDWELS